MCVRLCVCIHVHAQMHGMNEVYLFCEWWAECGVCVAFPLKSSFPVLSSLSSSLLQPFHAFVRTPEWEHRQCGGVWGILFNSRISWSETSTRVIPQRLPGKIVSGGIQTSGVGDEETKEPFCISHSCHDSLCG